MGGRGNKGGKRKWKSGSIEVGRERKRALPCTTGKTKGVREGEGERNGVGTSDPLRVIEINISPSVPPLHFFSTSPHHPSLPIPTLPRAAAVYTAYGISRRAMNTVFHFSLLDSGFELRRA